MRIRIERDFYKDGEVDLERFLQDVTPVFSSGALEEVDCRLDSLIKFVSGLTDILYKNKLIDETSLKKLIKSLDCSIEDIEIL